MNRKTVDIEKLCNICGKKFQVRIRKSDSRIMSKCWFSRIPARYMMYWHYEVISWKPMKTKIKFKNKFWKFLAYTKPQQWIIRTIWNLIHGRKKLEMWECKKCCSRPNDK